MSNIIKYVLVSFFSIAVYKYCIYKDTHMYDEQIYVAKNTERIFNYVFLMKDDTIFLKKVTIEMLQDYIIWLSEYDRDEKSYRDICTILKDDKLKNGLIDSEDKKLEKALDKIAYTCKRLKM